MKGFSLGVPLLLALALVGCGSSSHASSSSPTPAPAAGPTVVMKNIAFNPATLQARVGQTVTWTNQDDAPHNVTYVSGPKFTSSDTFTKGRSFSLELTAAGTIQYRCTIHPGMNGSIVVGGG